MRRPFCLLLVGLALLVPGCFSDVENPPSAIATRGDKLSPDVSYQVDLDGDSAPESIFIAKDSRSLTIRDEAETYHSRDKWQVVEAWLGDTDHNGLPEVVTLLDDEAGRHIGLFAYFGDQYRERLVTQELSPRPVSLAVVCRAAEQGGDLLLLVEEGGSSADRPASEDDAGVRAVFYRWNGFGFTALDNH